MLREHLEPGSSGSTRSRSGNPASSLETSSRSSWRSHLDEQDLDCNTWTGGDQEDAEFHLIDPDIESLDADFWLAGEPIELQLVMVNVSGEDNFDYPGTVLHTEHPDLTILDNGWYWYGMFADTEDVGRFTITPTADLLPGDRIELVATVVGLNCESDGTCFKPNPITMVYCLE